MKKITAALVLTCTAGLVIGLAVPAQATSPATNGGGVFHREHRTVYVENHAPFFPVYWAVKALRAYYPGVDVHYGACRTGASCSKVYQAHRARHADPGQTYFSVVYVCSGGICTKTNIIGGATKTVFDLDFPWSAHDRMQATMHEVLTMVGLAYRYLYWQGSALYRYLSRTCSYRPAWLDIYRLRQVYAGMPK